MDECFLQVNCERRLDGGRGHLANIAPSMSERASSVRSEGPVNGAIDGVRNKARFPEKAASVWSCGVQQVKPRQWARFVNRALVWWVVWGVASGANGLFAAQTADETRSSALKAAILYNFVHFVQWPEGSFADAKAPLVIGIFGDDPFGKTLDALVARERFENHPLVVERYHEFAPTVRSHILFVSVSERGRIKDLFATLKGRPVLTVSDFDGFIRSGGMVLMHEFIGERIQVRVNLTEIRSSRLTLSGKLLRVAESITPEQD